jgi:hypothetical protein
MVALSRLEDNRVADNLNCLRKKSMVGKIYKEIDRVVPMVIQEMNR